MSNSGTDAKACWQSWPPLGSEENRAGMARFGINTDRAFGVSMTSMRPLVRKYRRNHELAAALWAIGQARGAHPRRDDRRAEAGDARADG